MLFLKLFLLGGCLIIIKPGSNSAMRVPTDPTTSATTTKKGGKPPPKRPKTTTALYGPMRVPDVTTPVTTTAGIDWAVPRLTSPPTTPSTTAREDWIVPKVTSPPTTPSTTAREDWIVPKVSSPPTTPSTTAREDWIVPKVTSSPTTPSTTAREDWAVPKVTSPPTTPSTTTLTTTASTTETNPTVTLPATTSPPLTTTARTTETTPSVTSPVTTSPTLTTTASTTETTSSVTSPATTSPTLTTTASTTETTPSVTSPVTTSPTLTTTARTTETTPSVTSPATTSPSLTTTASTTETYPSVTSPATTSPTLTTTASTTETYPSVTSPATTSPTLTTTASSTETTPSVTSPATTSPTLTTTVTTNAPVTTTESKPISDIYYMKQLFKDFIESADSQIRPVINQSTPIHVHTKFIPISVVHFDMSEQKFSILAYFRVSWRDELIQWKPRNYNKLYYMKVPSADIWTPSLIIQKPYDGDGEIGEVTDITVISFKGKVQWVPDGTYSFVCDVNIQYYPFDEQVCTISYYMADETYNTLELTHDAEVDMSEMTENSAWEVLKLTVKNYLQKDVYYVDVKFHLQRRPNFTTYTLIMPLLMLAFLNVCIFLVPADSGEKGGFAITIFLSYGIFISILSDTLPNNSIQTSYFVIFITVLLGLSVISVFYVIIQAKVIYCMGVKESLIKCFIPEYMKGKKKMDGAQRSMDKFLNASTPSKKTSEAATAWKLIFHKIDMVLFFAFLVIALIATTTFFCIMLRRITESELNIGG